uniref:U3 small nucleolar RNA-associated protein NOL7 C-terminal domain-containing protein n=1 Tax=Salarias fasciatus TaxID=181472 RepID=A0A672GF45_SALFA
MVKKQRGKTDSSPKNMDREEHAAHFNDSSDEEAPDEVTFEDSKAQALRSMARAIETVRREKELLKEKRRKRQELFQEQKKRKLLPADVLEEIDSSPSKLVRLSDSHSPDSCFILFFSLKGSYTVTTTKAQTTSFQQQAAADFIQSRLYGPGSCRTTSKNCSTDLFTQ